MGILVSQDERVDAIITGHFMIAWEVVFLLRRRFVVGMLLSSSRWMDGVFYKYFVMSSHLLFYYFPFFHEMALKPQSSI